MTALLKRRMSHPAPSKMTHWIAPVPMESNSVCSVVKPKFEMMIVEKDPSPPVGIWMLFSPGNISDTYT